MPSKCGIRAVMFILGIGVMSPDLAWGQQNGLPDPSPELIRQDQRLEQLRRDQQSKASVRLSGDLEFAKQILPLETNCQNINEVTVEDWPDLSLTYLSALKGGALNDSPVGKCVGVQGIGVLVERLRNELIAKGFITSRVEVPSQNLASGRLTLRAVIGRVAAIEQPASAEKIRNLQPLASDQPLNLRDIEQSLENLRRNPNVQVEFQLKPGTLEDTTDVSIDYSRTRPLRASFSVDDSGSNTTGKLIGQGTWTWDSPLGISDLVYVSFGHDLGHRIDGPRGNRSKALHYSVPWGYWLFSVTGSQSRYHQTIAGAFQSYLYSGTSQSTELQIDRVIHRDAISKTTLEVKGFSRRSNNFVEDSEVQVQRRRTAGWELALRNKWQKEELAGDVLLSFKRGTGALRALSAPEELFGEGTSRMRVTTMVGNVQWSLLNSRKLTVMHQVRGQYNGTPLIAQDRLCLGGRASVRAFDGQESLCGDRGVLARNDLVWAVNESLAGYIGIDVGRVGGQSAKDLTERSMSGYVVGLRAEYRSPNRVQWNLDGFVGRPIHKPSFFKDAATTAGFSLSLNF